MAAIKQIKLPDGTIIAIDEWLHWPAFSTFEANAAVALDVRIFSYTVGNRVPQSGIPVTGARDASITDTNWTAKSRVNHDEAYIIYALTHEEFALEDNANFPNAPPDLQATAPIFRGTNLRLLHQHALVELFVGAGIDKPMVRAPYEYFGQGIGAPAYGSGDALLIAQGAATALELNYGTSGHVSVANQRVWQLPVYVGNDRVLHMDFSSPIGPIPGLDQDYRARWYMDGLKQRPIA